MTRVAVVGAGVAGVAAALAAAERGARVALLEAGDRIPAPKSGWASSLSGEERPAPSVDPRSLSAAGVELSLNQRVQKVERDLSLVSGGRRTAFDAVVLATGSRPAPEFVDGMRKPGVHVLESQAAFAELRECLRDYGKAVLWGSGPAVLEVAEKLRSRGLSVSIMAPSGIMPMLNEAPRRMLLDGISSWGVPLLGAKPDRVVGVDRVEAVVSSGEVVPCDSFVVLPRSVPLVVDLPATLGRTGGLVVNGSMRSSMTGLYGAGDCAEVPLGTTTVGVMFESSARLMGSVAGANAAGSSASARVAGSFFKEMFGVGVAVAGVGITEALGLGIDAAETSKSWRGDLACSLVFEKASKAVVGAQLAGSDTLRYAASLTLMVAAAMTLQQLAFQETFASSDISPITETARQALLKW